MIILKDAYNSALKELKEAIKENVVAIELYRVGKLQISFYYVNGKVEKYTCSSGADLYNDIEAMFFKHPSDFKNIALSSTGSTRTVVLKDNFLKMTAPATEPEKSPGVYRSVGVFSNFQTITKHNNFYFELYGYFSESYFFINNVEFSLEEIKNNESLKKQFFKYLVTTRESCLHEIETSERKNSIKKAKTKLFRINNIINSLGDDDRLLLEIGWQNDN